MFYKKDGDKVLFSGDGEAVYFIPEKYFNINTAITYGEYVDVMGIFLYGLYDKAGKLISLKPFKCPTMIKCRPSSVTKEPKLHLKGTSEEAAYRCLHFKDGDELICSTKVPKDVDNVEKFTTLLMRANLPEYIPYDQLHEYILANAELNGFNYKISPQIIGILISELCRCKNDLSKPFRYSNMDDMTDYKAISILQVPKYTSPYTAITSENADEAVAAAMTLKSNTHSPLEHIMMEVAALNEAWEREIDEENSYDYEHENGINLGFWPG